MFLLCDNDNEKLCAYILNPIKQQPLDNQATLKCSQSKFDANSITAVVCFLFFLMNIAMQA